MRMKILLKKSWLINLFFLALFSIYSTGASAADCTVTATASGTDSGGIIALVDDFSCVGDGVITGATLDATIGYYCTSWYSYNIYVNGTLVASQQCDQTGFDLTPYLPITSVSIESVANGMSSALH